MDPKAAVELVTRGVALLLAVWSGRDSSQGTTRQPSAVDVVDRAKVFETFLKGETDRDG